jgi:hypothetical protein
MVGERVERASAAPRLRSSGKPPARGRLLAKAVGGLADLLPVLLPFKGQYSGSNP